MKKLMLTLLACALLLCTVGCSGKNETVSSADNSSDETSTIISASEIDVDLTKLSSTMVYSEVYNIMYNSANYIGKTIKMNGAFDVYHDETTDKNYYACIIADALACCAQGIEFDLNGDLVYPNDYPDVGSDITVVGTFELYEEDGITYARLGNANMI